jgi:hypothetical protein
MAEKSFKKSRFKSLNPKADTSTTFASRLKQWRFILFQFSIGLSILWLGKILLMVMASELIFKFSATSAVMLDRTESAMETAMLITIALYAVFLIAWRQIIDEKFARLKLFCFLLAFLAIDLSLLKDSVEFINRWKSVPLGEKVVYAYQFPEWRRPGKYHSRWHTCSYMMFDYNKDLVIYPFPHPDHVSAGNVCVDVREGLLGLKWTEHVRSCKPAATNNQRVESSDLQSACQPSAAGMEISLGEIKRILATKQTK